MTAEAGPSLAVVLFTDLVGSTAQRAALGEERADELRKVHDRLLSERVEAHAGRVVKGLGDGIMAVFASASDALTAAAEAQQALCVYSRRSDAISPLSVRMGLSVGDVSWDAGECFGTPVVEAARLVAVADGAQIVCSDFVRVMARGRGGHRFSPLGALDLKGLPDPVETAQVEWEPPEHLATERLVFPRSLVVRSPLMFVGRDEELATAERHLKTTEGLGLLWLVGEPGIGKTRLAAEAARRAYDRGWDVLFGRCDEDLDVPFQPFLAALRDFVAATTPAVLPERLGRQPAELARLLPELTALVPGLVPTPATDPAVERYRLFEAVRSWLAVTAGVRPLLLVLDDLHWADAATIQLLGHLARVADPAPLWVLGTLRDTEPGTEELRRLLDDVAPMSTTIALGGLETGGVSRLVEAATGRSSTWDGTGLARQIQQETGGNPLFVVAVLAGLESGGTRSDLPGDVAAAVRRRLSRLPPATQDLLRAGSVVGLEFDLRVVGSVLGMPLGDTLEAVDAAVRGHLAEEMGVNRYRFTHALVRSALRREIGPSRAAHYHGLVGEALETLHADRLNEHVDALAYHYGEAAAAGGPADRALHYTLEAAKRAAGQYASQTAAERYRRALELLEAGRDIDAHTYCEVLFALGKAELWAGDFGEAQTTLRRATLEAEAAGFPELMAEAACDLEMSMTFPGLSGDEATELLERAALRLDPADSAGRARLLTGLARALGHSSRADEAGPILDAGIAMARRVGDGRALAEALYTVTLTLIGPEHVGRRLESTDEALGLARGTGDRVVHMNAVFVKGATLLETGDMRELRALIPEGAEVIRDLPTPWSAFFQTTLLGAVALVQGRFGEAEEMALAARDVGRDVTGIDPEGVYGLQMFGVRREQGRLDLIAPALRTLAQLGAGAQAWRPGLAALHGELGMLEEARAGLESIVTTEVLLPRDSRRGVSLSYLADAATFVGDGERASVLYQELSPYAELCITSYNTACYGPASRYLGMLAATIGRLDDAQAHFEDALVRCDRLESPTYAAHTQYQFARMLLARRRPGDTAQAELLAQAALETAARIGMRALEERASRLLESGLEVTSRDD